MKERICKTREIKKKKEGRKTKEKEARGEKTRQSIEKSEEEREGRGRRKDYFTNNNHKTEQM